MKRLRNTAIFSLIFMLILSTNVFAATPAPDLIGTSAISVDMDTGEIIYTKDIDAKAYPASITKLVTGLLLAENKSKGDNLSYTESAKAQPPYSYGKNVHPVNVGDTMRADNVMDGLLLYSGNDIAYMIADNVGGNAENFAKMMNDKLKALGMNNSHFITPNGLDDNTDDHYTTAYDLTKLGKAAYDNEWVRETMAKKSSVIGFNNGPTATVENRNKLVGINGNVGGKTGYTSKAGRCLVAIYERDGRHIIGVVMNSEYDQPADTKVFEDMTKLIDWSYSAERDTLVDKNTVVKTVSIPYKVIPFIGPEKTIEVPLHLNEDIQYYNNDVKPEQSFAVNNVSPWKINKSTELGTLTVTQRDYSKSYKLYSSISKKDIIKANLLIYIGLALGFIVLIVLIILLITSIKRRGRRRNRRLY